VPAGTWLRIAVADQGVGMSADVLARALEPFFTTKPVGQGTGLGLAMVYGTVVQHNGHVLVDSTPGRGTEVRLFFPPAPEGAMPEPLHQEPRVPPPPAALRVLLVEDEDAVRRVVERVLRQQQYDVLSAADGEEARLLCDDATLAALDLVVSDVVMPRLGGVELVTALRARRHDLPVLFVSGYRETNALDELLTTPHTVFLEKPFAPAALLEAVQLLLTSDATPAR
jgi:two-component system cell cycle sensor histidine kinase/response regulator CckA